MLCLGRQQPAVLVASCVGWSMDASESGAGAVLRSAACCVNFSGDSGSCEVVCGCNMLCSLQGLRGRGGYSSGGEQRMTLQGSLFDGQSRSSHQVRRAMDTTSHMSELYVFQQQAKVAGAV
jgi:hypothetical protein